MHIQKIFTILMLTFSFSCFSQTTSFVNNKGVLFVNGQPFLPLGFATDMLNTTDAVTSPQLLAAAGFNAGGFDAGNFDSATTTQILKNFTSAGLYTSLALPRAWEYPYEFDKWMNDYTKHPAVYSWVTADDSNFFTEEEMRRQYQSARKEDNSKVFYQSYAWPGNMVTHLPYTQISEIQSYPWGVNEDLSTAFRYYKSHADTMRATKRFPMGIIQCYNWTGQTFPPAAHLDCQSYLSYIAGNKGLHYYTLRDFNNNSTVNITQPALWNAAKRVATEILQTELKDVILFGNPQTVIQETYAYYGIWQHNNHVYVIAANANADRNIVFNISLPSNVTGGKRNMFKYRTDALRYIKQKNRLIGRMAPYQVCIYRLNTKMGAERPIIISGEILAS